MTKRFPGGVVSAQEAPTSATFASGIFSTTDQMQKVKAGTWPLKLSSSIQVLEQSSPYENAWAYSSATGFGTKYATPVDPVNAQGVQYSPSGDAILYSGNLTALAAPLVRRWSSSGGYGLRFTQPASYAGSSNFNPYHFKWSPTNKSIVMISNYGGGYYNLYSWGFDNLTGITPVRTLATPNVSNLSEIIVGPNSSQANYVMAFTGSSPYFRVFPYTDADGITSATPLSQTNNVGLTGAFAGDYSALSTDGKYFMTYNGSGVTTLVRIDPNGYIGTAMSSPSGSANIGFNAMNSIRWSPQQNYVAIGGGSTPFVAVYSWNNTPGSEGIGTRFSNPSTLPSTTSSAVRWAADEGSLLLGSYTGAAQWTVSAYQWSPSGFGTKFSDPATGYGSYYKSGYVGKNLAVSPN